MKPWRSFLRILKAGTARVVVAAATLLSIMGQRVRALELLCKIHRSAYSEGAARATEKRLRRTLSAPPDDADRQALDAMCERFLDEKFAHPRVAAFRQEPYRMLTSRVIVLKSFRNGEKGVILLDYSFSFPLFARLFDVEAIAERYAIVLEPSWCGFCSPEILTYTRFSFPVYVLSGEPRDTAFLVSLGANLIPIPVAGNWWVDHRVFRPLAGVVKDIDVAVVAAWARYKDHQGIFAALADLAGRGHRVKTLLIGYPGDLDREAVLAQARAAGVDSLLEVHESLTPEEVNGLLNRAKVNLLWSRKEGFNRAIVEGMFAGVPCILRRDHNFGYHYPHVNPMTGMFASTEELPDAILSMIRDSHLYAPRDWVAREMTCQNAAHLVGAALRARALSRGEPWTADLAVKTVALHGMRYWDEAEAARFDADYAFLKTQVRASSESKTPPLVSKA